MFVEPPRPANSGLIRAWRAAIRPFRPSLFPPWEAQKPRPVARPPPGSKKPGQSWTRTSEQIQVVPGGFGDGNWSMSSYLDVFSMETWNWTSVCLFVNSWFDVFLSASVWQHEWHTVKSAVTTWVRCSSKTTWIFRCTSFTTPGSVVFDRLDVCSKNCMFMCFPKATQTFRSLVQAELTKGFWTAPT